MLSSPRLDQICGAQTSQLLNSLTATVVTCVCVFFGLVLFFQTSLLGSQVTQSHRHLLSTSRRICETQPQCIDGVPQRTLPRLWDSYAACVPIFLPLWLCYFYVPGLSDQMLLCCRQQTLSIHGRDSTSGDGK